MLKYEPWIAETCTGDGILITLTGALDSEHNRVQDAYDDGDLVPYTIVDVAGAIKAEGIGTFNSGANTISRVDYKTWDGVGPGYEDLPSSPVALSNATGPHKFIVTQISESIVQAKRLSTDRYFLNPCYLQNQAYGGWAANTIHFTPFMPDSIEMFTVLGTVLDAALASQTIKIGIYRSRGGLPYQLPFRFTGDMDAGTAGIDVEQVVSQFNFENRLHFTGIISTAAGARPECGGAPIENLLGGDAARLGGTATISHLTWAPSSYANAFTEAPPTTLAGYGLAIVDRYPYAYAKK